jgi:uncharacterized membrane protein
LAVLVAARDVKDEEEEKEEMEEGWLSITSMTTSSLLSIAIALELVRVLAMLELGWCCSKVFKVVSPFMEVLLPPR